MSDEMIEEEGAPAPTEVSLPAVEASVSEAPAEEEEAEAPIPQEITDLIERKREVEELDAAIEASVREYAEKEGRSYESLFAKSTPKVPVGPEQAKAREKSPEEVNREASAGSPRPMARESQPVQFAFGGGGGGTSTPPPPPPPPKDEPKPVDRSNLGPMGGPDRQRMVDNRSNLGPMGGPDRQRMEATPSPRPAAQREAAAEIQKMKDQGLDPKVAMRARMEEGPQDVSTGIVTDVLSNVLPLGIAGGAATAAYKGRGAIKEGIKRGGQAVAKTGRAVVDKAGKAGKKVVDAGKKVVNKVKKAVTPKTKPAPKPPAQGTRVKQKPGSTNDNPVNRVKDMGGVPRYPKSTSSPGGVGSRTGPGGSRQTAKGPSRGRQAFKKKP